MTSDDLRIRRRALLALGSCPAAFAVPLIEKAVTTPIPRKTHAYEVARNAATALVALNVPECLPVIALMFGGFWHADHISHIVSSYVCNHLPAVHQLLYAEDIILRLGAIRLLKSAPPHDSITRLRKLISEKREQTRSWKLDELPEWVTVTEAYSLLGFHDYSKWVDHPEIEVAEMVIRNIESELNSAQRYRKLHEFVDEIISDFDSSRLRDALPTLDYDEGAVIKILQAGLERRDPKKWRVRKSRQGISIEPRARSGDLKQAQSQLLVLLNIENHGLYYNGVHIGTRHWQLNDWKEYAYRCWGWER